MKTSPLQLFAKALGLLLLVAAPAVAQAQLTYVNVDGAGLVFDAVDNVYWTQEANLSGTTNDFADSQSYAANLSYAGIGAGNWKVPTGAEFTYIYSQLPANGADNTDHYGLQESFGPGPNDYFSDVAPEYWTDTDATDFNFFYGFPGSQPDSNEYPDWVVTSAPEPGTAALGLLAAVLSAARWRRARK